MKQKIKLFCIVLLLNQVQFNAQNKEIAIAYPAKTISIDGNLSDWPKALTKHPITFPVWQSSDKTTSDYSGYFLTAFNQKENSLYLAIVTEDKSNVVIKDDIEIGDLYALFLDEKHHKKGSGIIRYKMSALNKSITDSKELWDNSLKNELNWNFISYKTGRLNNEIIYEIKIRLKKPIYSGRVIGLGHLLQDVDSDNETVYAWVGRGDKDFSAQPGRIGSLLFLDEEKQIGNLKGKVIWKNKDIQLKPEGIRITNSTNDWFYVKVDEEGNFNVNLPYGSYTLSPGKTAFFQDDTFIKINKNKTTKITINSNKNEVIYALEEIEKPNFNFKSNLLKKEDKKEIDKIITSLMDYYEVEGATLSIFKNNKIYYIKPYGVKNAYSNEKTQESTLFEVASITKTVFAYLVLRLYDKGILDLDEKMYQKLSFEEIEHNSFAKLITPRIILSHQTGLPNWREGSTIEFEFKPGTGFSYSGEAYQYLQRYLEKITGKTINQLFTEEVTEPLQLDDFYFQHHETAFKNKSNGHYNGFPSAIDLPENPWVAGCLVANAKNMAKFLVALNQGKGLKPETYKLMISNQNKVPENFKENIWGFEEYMGLGVFVEKSPEGLLLRHSGNNGDFKSIYKIDKKSNSGYFIAVNGNTGDFLINELEKYILSF